MKNSKVGHDRTFSPTTFHGLNRYCDSYFMKLTENKLVFQSHILHNIQYQFSVQKYVETFQMEHNRQLLLSKDAVHLATHQHILIQRVPSTPKAGSHRQGVVNAFLAADKNSPTPAHPHPSQRLHYANPRILLPFEENNWGKTLYKHYSNQAWELVRTVRI